MIVYNVRNLFKNMYFFWSLSILGLPLDGA